MSWSEQIADSRVEDEFRSHPGVDARDDDGVGLLFAGGLGTAGAVLMGMDRGVGGPAPVAFPQHGPGLAGGGQARGRLARIRRSGV